MNVFSTPMKQNNIKHFITEENLNVITIEENFNEKELPSINIIKKSLLNLKLIDETFKFDKISASEIIQIWDSNLTKVNPQNLYSNLQELKGINLIDTTYPKDFNFSMFQKLEELEFNFNSPAKFQNCHKLRKLIVRKAKSYTLNFEGLESLEILELIQCKIEKISNLEKCINLKAITFYNSEIINKFDISVLNKLPNLEYIHFANYHENINLGVLENCQNLKCVILENNLKVEEPVKYSIVEQFKYKVNIIGKSNLTKEQKKSIQINNEKCTYGYFLKNRIVDRLKV